MRLRRSISIVGLLVLSSVLAGAAETPGEGGGTEAVRVVLELNQQFYYAGEPFPLRVSVMNSGGRTASNPVKTPIVRGIEVRGADGSLIEAKGKSESSEPAPRPDKLGASGFFGTIVDLTEVYPEMRKPGRFSIRWAADGLSSDTINVTVIPRFDPRLSYRTRVETDEGAFVIDFLGEAAPLATKAFVDLANAGFYDGLLFHEVRPDWYVASGDPNGDGSGSAPFRIPAEQTSTPVVAGTVLMKPVGTAPPANSSQFIIMLRPEPSWRGQFTVVGQIVEGLDVVQKISRLPSNQQTARPYYKPLKDVRISRMTVVEGQPAVPTATVPEQGP